LNENRLAQKNVKNAYFQEITFQKLIFEEKRMKKESEIIFYQADDRSEKIEVYYWVNYF
jgi:hypothetical protein